jgi:hypothetical protein
VQPMLRTITIAIGWTAVLSNSIYGLFAPRFLGFRQPELSATYSAAAALAIGAQMGFPRVVAAMGEHMACTLGIVAAAVGIGGQALLRTQPLHSLLYLTNRVGATVADTATAALVARSSEGRDSRARNLALLTSTRAAARIASPLLSSKLFELSCSPSGISIGTGPGGSGLGAAAVAAAAVAARLVPPGALPFVTAACFTAAVAPLPLVLFRAEQDQGEERSPR